MLLRDLVYHRVVDNATVYKLCRSAEDNIGPHPTLLRVVPAIAVMISVAHDL
jgi:hypothetical protein